MGIIGEIVRIDHKGLTLPIEGVNFEFFGIIEALLRKVFGRAFHSHGHQIALFVPYESFGSDIINEVEMSQRVIMEKVDEYQVVCQEAARDVWMREIMVAHGEVVKADDFIDVHLTFLYLLFSPHLLTEGT